MRAIVYERFGSSKELKLTDQPKPEPGPTEVQIRLAYSGVNPVDWKIREGHLKDVFPHEFPIIPGWEGSGVVSSVGNAVRRVRVGDEVYGCFRQPLIKCGTYAEFLVVPEDFVVLKPEKLSLLESASIPLTALAAWQAIFDAAELKEGESVLVQGAAGGVGGMCVQLAHWAKATVFATAKGDNHAYVISLGADHVIDYTKGSVKEELLSILPEGVDLVIDCVGKEIIRKSSSLVKKGGRLVSVVSPDVKRLESKDLKTEFVFVAPSHERLSEIGFLFNHGKLKVPHIQEMLLEDAAKALDLNQEGHSKGKVVLKI